MLVPKFLKHKNGVTMGAFVVYKYITIRPRWRSFGFGRSARPQDFIRLKRDNHEIWAQRRLKKVQT